ncbi:MAG: choice-of-anchor J domain-containing protein, partial [Muribaculaceae bacterium]|nr:choice-of-anchor J domain-containing protein [Muribaculaceae bacterium]
VCFYSSSYDYNYGGALTPDNWLFTPAVGMGGTLKFDAWQRSASYPDKFMVYVAPAEYETIDEFVPVSEFIIPTGTTPESFEIDLSEYEGMGVIAFRHYDCNDQWSIYLDNIAVEIPGAVEPAEWTLCENVENPYTIEGLMPDTKYEAQVMAIGPDGRTTDWTESVLFTTEVGAEPETGFFLVGTFNEWELTEEGGRIEFDNENRAEVRLQAGDEFKVITPAEDGGWLWFGGIDDNNVGYFLITPELLSHNLTLVDGANFRVEEGGLYHVNLVWNRDMPNYIVVTLAEPNAISTVGVDKTDNVYYNLLGVKFNGMPTTPGIYINNGKKVVIK